MDFARVEAKFGRLKAQFESGALTEEEFKAQLEELMLEDEQGRWWIIGYETGQWYVHDGEKWVQQESPPPKDLRPAPPDFRETERPLSDAWAKLRKKLSVPSGRLLIASYSIPVVTFLVNYALVDPLFGYTCRNYRYGPPTCPDWVHLGCAAAMPAVLPVALVLLRSFPGVVTRSLVFVGVVMSLYWIGAPIFYLALQSRYRFPQSIYRLSVLVLLGSTILSFVYALVVHLRAKRRAGRSRNLG